MASSPPAALLAFEAGGRRLYVPAGAVREVSRIPQLTGVPHAPRSLLGVGSMRGEPKAVVSVSRLLNADQGVPKRLIVLHEADQPAFAVDRIEGVVQEPGDRQSFEFEALLASDFVSRSSISAGSKSVEFGSKAEAQERLDLLSFEIGNQLFALPIADVETVLKIPSDVAKLPRTDNSALGTIRYRSALLPLLSLSALLSLQSSETQFSRIVVTSIHGHLVGLVVDRMGALLRVSTTTIDSVPAPLLRTRSETVIAAIHRPADDGRLVSILAPEQLLAPEWTGKLKSKAGRSSATRTTKKVSAERLLLIECGTEVLAIPIAAIDGLARSTKFTPLPNTPDFVIGLMNHRGEALPVIDLTFHLTGTHANLAKSRLLVVRIAGAEAALLVDHIIGISAILSSEISAAPSFGNERTKTFDRVVATEAGQSARLVMSANELFGQVEADLIAATISTRRAE